VGSGNDAERRLAGKSQTGLSALWIRGFGYKAKASPQACPSCRRVEKLHKYSYAIPFALTLPPKTVARRIGVLRYNKTKVIRSAAPS